MRAKGRPRSWKSVRPASLGNKGGDGDDQARRESRGGDRRWPRHRIGRCAGAGWRRGRGGGQRRGGGDGPSRRGHHPACGWAGHGGGCGHRQHGGGGFVRRSRPVRVRPAGCDVRQCRHPAGPGVVEHDGRGFRRRDRHPSPRQLHLRPRRHAPFPRPTRRRAHHPDGLHRRASAAISARRPIPPPNPASPPSPAPGRWSAARRA